jgi:hypothetical protein
MFKYKSKTWSNEKADWVMGPIDWPATLGNMIDELQYNLGQIMIVLVLAIGLLTGVQLLDVDNTLTHTATIIDGGFVEGEEGTDDRVGVSTDGELVYIPGDSGTPDKYVMVFRLDTGEFVKFAVPLDFFYTHKPGDVVTIWEDQGKFLGFGDYFRVEYRVTGGNTYE